MEDSSPNTYIFHSNYKTLLIIFIKWYNSLRLTCHSINFVIITVSLSATLKHFQLLLKRIISMSSMKGRKMGILGQKLIVLHGAANLWDSSLCILLIRKLKNLHQHDVPSFLRASIQHRDVYVVFLTQSKALLVKISPSSRVLYIPQKEGLCQVKL